MLTVILKRENRMLFNKITIGAAALSVMSWVSTPVFAGHNPMGHSNGHGHAVGISGVSTAGTGHHGGTKGHGHHLDGSDNPHGNKGGAMRGLDRADQVAGSHGRKGGRTPQPIIPAITTPRTTPTSSANRPTSRKLTLAQQGARPAQKSSGSSRKL
jgi:hypothetical protein